LISTYYLSDESSLKALARPDLACVMAGSARTNNADEMRRNSKAGRPLHSAEPRMGIVDTSTSKRKAPEES
jgi:hypothetical protein